MLVKIGYLLNLFLIIDFLLFSSGSVLAECELSYPDQYPFSKCSNTEKLTWDWGSSIQVIGSTSSGDVAAKGGVGKYVWTIDGNGFFFDAEYTLKTITTDSSKVTIYTKKSCGSAVLTVTDFCRTVTGYIRSDNGLWRRIGSWRTRDYIKKLDQDIYKCVTNIYSWDTDIRISEYKGKYAIGINYKSPEYDSDTTYSGGMHPWCATSDIKAMSYVDPIVGLFKILGTTGHNHYLNPNSYGVDPKYRVGYYASPGVNNEIHVFEFSCN